MSIKFGFLGASRMGRIHIQNALTKIKEIECAAICDPHLDEDWAHSTGVEQLTKDEEVFWNYDLDGVLICSPTNQHARQIERALHQKLHVFCEKPLDQNLDVHRRIRHKVLKASTKFQIGFNRRFDRDFAAIQQKVQDGEIGSPYLLRITSRDPGLPSMEYLQGSGGLFMDMTIHDFDMARYIMNSPVVEVYACGASLVDPLLEKLPDIDTAVLTLKFANGAFGVIDNCRQAVYGYDQRIEVFGSQGSLCNRHHQETSLIKKDAQGIHENGPLHFFLERYMDSYEQELRAFARTILSHGSPTPSIEDSWQAILIAKSAQASYLENRPVIIGE